MTIDMLLKINDDKLKDAIWAEDKDAIVQIIKSAYDEGYTSGFLNGYDLGYKDIPEVPWR